MSVWVSGVMVVLCLSYALYRLGLSVAAIRADRAGNAGRAQLLRQRGSSVFLAAVSVLTIALFVGVIVVLVTH